MLLSLVLAALLARCGGAVPAVPEGFTPDAPSGVAAGDVLDLFKEKTGIELEYIYGGGEELVDRIWAEKASHSVILSTETPPMFTSR